MIAYCYRSGQIGFARRLPKGALPIASMKGRALRPAVEVIARLAYDNTTLLVPGIPEAASDTEALAALRLFSGEVRRRLPQATFFGRAAA